MGGSTDLVGKVLQGTYKITRLIGAGGMGAVYEASHQRLLRRFAIKVLIPAMAEHKDAMARFQREAEVTSAIGNPHILEVIDFNHTPDGSPYIVMELLEGEDLAVRLSKTGKLPLDQVASILSQSASALQAAHDKGVVHRDLKPQNIFLCQRGKRNDFVKVVDFGISKVLSSGEGFQEDNAMGVSKILAPRQALTADNIILGTPEYMAPEQLEGGSAQVDHRSDLYAMGILVYEMLAGRPPFCADSLASLVYKVVHVPPPSLIELRPDIPEAVENVINQALKKDKAHRFESMSAFWNAFQYSLKGETVLLDVPTEDHQLHVIPIKEIDPALAKTTPAPVPLSAGESLAAKPPEVQSATMTWSPPEDLEQPAEQKQEHQAEPRMKSTTTMSASTGETVSVTAPRLGRRTFLAGLGALALALVMGGILLTWRSGSTPEEPDSALRTAARLAPDVGAPTAQPPPKRVAVPQPDGALPDRGLPDSALPDSALPDKKLEATPSTRELYLTTKPEGVQVFLDGKIIGRTPLRGVAIPVTSAAITLQQTGYRDHSLRLKQGTDTVKLRTIRLMPIAQAAQDEPAGRTATLQISTLSYGQPLTANVFLDGKRIGQSPLYLTGISTGVHVLEARQPGYRKTVKRVRLRAGRNSIVLDLER